MRDADVRAATRLHLAEEHRGDKTTVIVEEMPIWSGTVRIDIAVINGELSGYELKSDKDTLNRLPYQADIYSRVFDRVTLVSGARHADKAANAIPEWWGLYRATQRDHGVVLEVLKESQSNPSQDPYLIAELLRKDEAISVLETHDLASGWRSKRLRQLHERLASELPMVTLKSAVRTALKSRKF